jgi:tRNA(Ile)-lysidine synthase
VSGPDPAVATVRRAVRAVLADREPGDLVLVACSGGADSLALADAAVFEARAAAVRVGAVVVDHGLQEGSADQAATTAATLRVLGLDPVEVATVTVDGGGGPEAAARTARYRALDDAADRLRAAAVLLGHTRDDQAETVLLALARGSGTRSLAGMAPVSASGRYLRPLLAVDRVTTVAACAAAGLRPWLDPHNADPRYARVRVRAGVLPVLERELGPGVAAALARSAALSRADADALDAIAGQAAAAVTDADGELEVAALAQLLPAVRTRVLRSAALAAGCPATDLSAAHVLAVEALVVAWHGQRGVDLPGGVVARRACDRLSIRSATAEPATVRAEDCRERASEGGRSR